PLIANFFERNELIGITRILGLSIFIKAITLTEFTRLRKDLRFKKIALIQVISSAASVITAYYLALKGFGYWAIVAQTLTIALVNLTLVITINKWTPHFYFSWKRYKVMRGFSNNMLISYFTNQLGQNMYSVFIGKFQPTAVLGYFNQATKLNDVSFQSVNSVILTTSYPIIAKEKDIRKRKEMYKSILNHFLFIHFTISMFIIGCSNNLVVFLFGKQWEPTGEILSLIVISFLIYPLTTLNANIIKIENKSGLYRNLAFLRNGLLFFSLLLTYRFSIEIVLLGLIIARYISVIIDTLLCGKYINFLPVEQFYIAFKQFISPLISCLITVYIIQYLNLIIIWQSLLAFTFIFFLIFTILNVLTRNQSFFMFLNKVKSLIK
ncbi:MAG: oligosaccharide flippase family protein, partial [Xanthomarina sp.]